jgi:hypothetical protein
MALANYLHMPLPPWIADLPRKDNWLAVAKLRAQTEAADSRSDKQRTDDGRPRSISVLLDDHHEF